MKNSIIHLLLLALLGAPIFAQSRPAVTYNRNTLNTGPSTLNFIGSSMTLGTSGTGSLQIGSAGVEFSDDGAGGITLLGLAGTEEDFKFALGSANVVTVTSSTGANIFNFSGFTLQQSGVAVASGGTTITIDGTANEITSSAGAQSIAANRTWTLSLPATIDLGGKTSFEVPNAAAPTVDAFGEIAGDNNLWAASRGAILSYDGTAVTALVGVLTSDTPSNGQVPVWNTGGTITWETISSGGDVVGPASSTDNALVRFDSTTGKLIQNSTATLSDTGTITITNASGVEAIHIGNSSYASTEPSITIARLIPSSEDNLTNSHAFVDGSTYSRTNSGWSVNSYDARVSIGGTRMGHYAAFQSIPRVLDDGFPGILYNFVSLPQFDAGASNNTVYGLYTLPTIASGAIVGASYGVYIATPGGSGAAGTDVGLYIEARDQGGIFYDIQLAAQNAKLAMGSANDLILYRKGARNLGLWIPSSLVTPAYISAPDAVGSNIGGSPMVLAGGSGTGTGVGGYAALATAPSGSSGATTNALVLRYVTPPEKTVTDAATSLFEIALPTLRMAGGSIRFTVIAADATDVQSYSGLVTYSVVNKGGVYTKAVTAPAANDATAVSAGTLTATFAFLDGTDKVTMQVTPAGSLTETTYRIWYTLENNSGQAITFL